MIFQCINQAGLNLNVAYMNFVCNVDECSADKTDNHCNEYSVAHVFSFNKAKIHKIDHIIKTYPTILFIFAYDIPHDYETDPYHNSQLP